MRKPEYVEAVQITSGEPTFAEAPDWLVMALGLEKGLRGSVYASDGYVRCDFYAHSWGVKGDWVLRLSDESLTIVKDETFQHYYQPA